MTNPSTSSDPTVGNLNLTSVCCCACITHTCIIVIAHDSVIMAENSSVLPLQLSGSAAPRCTQSGPFWVLTIKGARSKTVVEVFRNTHATSGILGLDLAALLMERPCGNAAQQIITTHCNTALTETFSIDSVTSDYSVTEFTSPNNLRCKCCL